MNEERMMILKMLQGGEISADEAAKLLETLEKSQSKTGDKETSAEPAKGQGKYLRVRVSEIFSGKVITNIRVPISMIGIGAKFGAHFTPHIHGIESEELMRAVLDGEVGEIVDVIDDEDGEHVEVFIE